MRVYLCIGSNLDDREARLAKAICSLSQLLSGMVCSSCYLTPAEQPLSAGAGCESDARPYLNAVVYASYAGDYDSLCAETRRIEAQCGRNRAAAPDVAMDIDIVMADGTVLRPGDFAAPHFRIGYRQLQLQDECQLR